MDPYPNPNPDPKPMLNNKTTPPDSPSDCESGVSGSDQTIPRRQWEEINDVIRRKFVQSMASAGLDARVESVVKKQYDNKEIMGRAKLQSFSLYMEAVRQRRGGDPNLRYGWFGASKGEVQRIFSSHRFALPLNSGEFGQGVYLCPVNLPQESMHSAPADENGLRHMILCRVILGNMEVVRPGSGQYNPSSEEFDSGVDDLVSPKKYIIWNGDMNTHILPEFVVSFRISMGDRGCQAQRVVNAQPMRLPTSEWVTLSTLVKELTRVLPADAIRSITKDYDEFKRKKITRDEMIRRLRNIAGDKLLVTILKSSRERMKGFRSCSSCSKRR